MDAFQTINTGLTAIGKVVDYIKTNIFGHVVDSSLTQITKLTRAEPLTVISADMMNHENLPALLRVMCSMYSGYYLQAASFLTQINSIETVRVLDALNPNRDSTGFLLQSRMQTVAAESAASMDLSRFKYSLPTRHVMAAEAAEDNNIKVIYEHDTLAIGQLLHLTICQSVKNEEGEERKQNIVIPITVRLATNVVQPETLEHIFTHAKDNDSLVERYHAVKSGRIEFIRDGIFCQDLIDAYRKAAIKDQSGVLQEIQRRANANRAYGLVTKNPSLAIATNLYVMSKQIASKLEAELGFKFNSSTGREKLFKGTYAMIVAVYDDERDIINFYFNGIAQPSVITGRSLKSNGKKGMDVGEVMRVLLEGRAPTF